MQHTERNSPRPQLCLCRDYPFAVLTLKKVVILEVAMMGTMNVALLLNIIYLEVLSSFDTYLFHAMDA